jgi:hypothetical protein
VARPAARLAAAEPAPSHLVARQPAPDANEECYLYQTLLGAWPVEPVSDAEHAAFTERITQHMLKAVKEAKVHASWVHPNPDYDAAIARFVAAILDRSEPPARAPGRSAPPDRRHRADAPSNAFLADFRPFQQRSRGGRSTTRSRRPPEARRARRTGHLPGNRGVGPDPGRSRQPAAGGLRAAREDLRALRATLAGPAPDRAALARSLLAAKEDGRIKLYVTHEALAYRRRHPALFAEGAYLPLGAHGPRSENVVAFGRALGDERVIAAVPRLLARLHPSDPPVGAAWAGTWLELPDEGAAPAYRNVLTGEQWRSPRAMAGPGWRSTPSSRSSPWRSSRGSTSAEPIIRAWPAGPERRQSMAAGSASFHEAEDKLTPQTRDMHRAIVSLMEELEAIDWYQQRIEASRDGELKDILATTETRRKEHAAMVLEWIRRRDSGFDEVLRTLLFTERPITALEPDAPTGNGRRGGRRSKEPSVTVGSLRGAR